MLKTFFYLTHVSDRLLFKGKIRGTELLLANIRQRLQVMLMTNILAYLSKASVTNLKRFITMTLGINILEANKL
jgi:hypothetical protein